MAELKKTNIQVTRYEYEDYYIDVSVDNVKEVYECSINRKGYGISSFMVGLPFRQPSISKDYFLTYDMFLNYVISELEDGECIGFYEEDCELLEMALNEKWMEENK